MTLRRWQRLPTLRAVHLLMAPALVFIAACLDRQYQTDFWQHLARGRQIVARGRLLDVDIFTVAVAGTPIRDANWLTQVIYWRIYSWVGLNGVQIVNAAMLALALLLLVRLCMRVQPSTRAAGLAGAAVFLGLWSFALIRPQTGSFILFILLLAFLIRGGWAIWLAAPIMALWANIHGGFAIGLVLIGAFVLESALAAAGRWPMRLWRRAPMSNDALSPGSPPKGAWRTMLLRCVLLAICLAATCFNPYGAGVYQYATTLTARAAGRGIEEWLPPSLSSAGGWVLLLWLTALAISAWIARRRPTVLQWCLLVCFVPLACRSVRMIPWLLLATAPMLAEMLASAMERRLSFSRRACSPFLPSQTTHGEQARRLNDAVEEPSLSAALLCLILLFTAAMSIPSFARVNPLFGTVRSNHRVEDDLRAANAVMAERGPGRVFTRIEWAEYFTFAAFGANPVLFDGHIELYPDDLWKEYLQISAGKGDFERILDAWEVDYLILDDQYHSALLTQIGRSRSWKTVWRSGHVVLLIRSAPRPAGRKIPIQAITDAR